MLNNEYFTKKVKMRRDIENIKRLLPNNQYNFINKSRKKVPN